MALSNLIPSKSNSIDEVFQLAQQVLLVDSSPISIKLIADEVIDLNHIYQGAVSTIEQLETVLAVNEPDAIFINSYLKGKLDGFQIAKILKLDYDIPFYMVLSEKDRLSHKWMTELNPDGIVHLSNSAQPLRKQIKILLD